MHRIFGPPKTSSNSSVDQAGSDRPSLRQPFITGVIISLHVLSSALDILKAVFAIVPIATLLLPLMAQSTSLILSKKLIFIINCSICYLYFIVAK